MVNHDITTSSSYSTVSQDVFTSISDEQKTFSQEKKDILQINDSIGEIPLDTSQDLFEQHYMDVVTREFENELDELRKDPSFDPQEMPLLVSALKKGVNIFSPEEKQKVLDNLAQKDKNKSKNDL